MDLIKVDTLCSATDPTEEMKEHVKDGEKIFASHTADKGLVSSIYKELSKAENC